MTVSPYEATVAWLESFVIGMNLCPFAAKPWNRGQVRIHISEAADTEAMAREFLAELQTLNDVDADTLATTLLVIPRGLESFFDYLDFLDLAQQLLEQAGLEGSIQLASFHPDYCFEGETEASPGNYTNRSPLPMLHLIREEEIEAVLQVYPDPDAIPDNNIRKMESLGLRQLQQLLAHCLEPPHES